MEILKIWKKKLHIRQPFHVVGSFGEFLGILQKTIHLKKIIHFLSKIFPLSPQKKNLWQNVLFKNIYLLMQKNITGDNKRKFLAKCTKGFNLEKMCKSRHILRKKVKQFAIF
jgi:hypothetical protein